MANRKSGRGGGREITFEYKLLVVQERMRGTPADEVARVFAVSKAAVDKWSTAFRKHGPSALRSKRSGPRPKRPPNPVIREHVVALKREHEPWGTRRIRDVLARFEAVGVSEQQVRRILHDAGLIEPPRPAPAREHGPRRFERATPNQLWQSDIFTFRLRRAERLYVCVFMDDHSRYIVGHALAHHQKSALVMEAFERALSSYGQPTEVLTDNGRQYTVWRGKTEFEELLARSGIHHIRSRPQHPQTLGKVERFWKTLWDEFLGRTVFAHAVDAQQRLVHYLTHYNFQRPHQALDGLVPADRFFKAAAHVRAEIERAIAANALRLALEQPMRKPFYVVGQLGDQRLSIAAGNEGLEVHLGDRTQTIPLTEDTDGTTTARRFTEAAARTTEPADPALADAEAGPRRGREEPRAAGPGGAVGREAGVDSDRGVGDLARLLLSARNQGAQRDAAGAGAGRGWGREPGRDRAAPADQGADREGGARGAGATTGRAPAVRAAQADEHGAGEDAPRPTDDDDNGLDAHWAQKLALLDDDDEADAEEEPAERVAEGAPVDFDPDAGWRERGPLIWERKLAGVDAVSDRDPEDLDAQRSPALVQASAGTTDRSTAAPSIRRDHVGAGTDADGDGSSDVAGHVAQPLPDDLASRDRGDHRGDDAQAGGAAGEAGAGGSAGGGAATGEVGAGGAAGARGDDEADDGRADVDGFWTDAFDAIARSLEEDQAERGSGTGDDAPPGGDRDA
jgi:transposase InsO family protein